MLLYDNTVDVNILKPRKHDRHIADGIFNRIFFNENISILIKFSPKFFVSLIHNKPSLVAWQQAFIWTNNDDLVYRPYASLGFDELTHWGRDEIDAISQTTFSNAFSWMKVYKFWLWHYDDVIMTMLASQITSLTVVYSIVYSGVNQIKHQSSASLAFLREIHRGPVNSPHKWPVTRKMFPVDDVNMT